MSAFTLETTDGLASAGVLHTAHGDVPTPAFMPVGTKGTVKTVDPRELRELGTTILLGNTYHLHFRPGDDLVAELAELGLMGVPYAADYGGSEAGTLAYAITIEELASGAGISRPTFYFYFDSREAVIRALSESSAVGTGPPRSST